jgi:hypothetical protein
MLQHQRFKPGPKQGNKACNNSRSACTITACSCTCGNQHSVGEGSVHMQTCCCHVHALVRSALLVRLTTGVSEAIAACAVSPQARVGLSRWRPDTQTQLNEQQTAVWPAAASVMHVLSSREKVIHYERWDVGRSSCDFHFRFPDDMSLQGLGATSPVDGCAGCHLDHHHHVTH